MIRVKVTKLHELTVLISPGAFRTIPQGCEGEVPGDAPVVVEALKQGMIERKVEPSDGTREDAEPRGQGAEGSSEAKQKKTTKKRTVRKK